MKDLDIGDSVLSVDSNGVFFFDSVYRVAHYDPDLQADFLKIWANDQVLEISPAHLLYIGGCCDIGSEFLKEASSAKVGDTVFVVADGFRIQVAKISKIEKIKKSGVFNVHVYKGNIVVNNVVASHYIAKENYGWFNHVVAFWSPLLQFVSPSRSTRNAAILELAATKASS